MAQGFRRIAKIVKTHGSKGEIVTVPVDGLPSVLYEGLTVCIVPPALKASRWYSIQALSSTDKGQLLQLSDVHDLAAAKALCGKWILASEKDVPEDLYKYSSKDLCGRTVIDTRLGSIGTITDILVGPLNNIWVVEGQPGETLIPVVDAIVNDIPPSGDIIVTCPRGLVPTDVISDSSQDL